MSRAHIHSNYSLCRHCIQFTWGIILQKLGFLIFCLLQSSLLLINPKYCLNNCLLANGYTRAFWKSKRLYYFHSLPMLKVWERLISSFTRFFLTFTINCTLPAVLRMSFWRSFPNINVINLPIQLQGLPLVFYCIFVIFQPGNIDLEVLYHCYLPKLPLIIFQFFLTLLSSGIQPHHLITFTDLYLHSPLPRIRLLPPICHPQQFFKHPVTHLSLHQAVSSSPFLPCVRSTTLLTILLK